MDPRLLRLFQTELRHLRDVAVEFRREHPKVAKRLDLRDTECADPYVERLLEGFAFLTSRIQLEFDKGYARLARHLLQVVAPSYVAPTPSMTIARFHPTPDEGSLAEGVSIPRHTQLRSRHRKGEQTPCLFRTAHEVTLWPIEVSDAEFLPYSRTLADLGLSHVPGAESALRLRLRATAGTTFGQVRLDKLPLYLHGSERAPVELLEQLAGHAVAVFARPTERPAPWTVDCGRNAVVHVGFADDEALLPYARREFSGHRLLHEYFALPERAMFVRLDGLAAPFARHAEGTELDLFVVFDRRAPNLENSVTASQFVPFCSPAINLFPRGAERIHLDPKKLDHHLVVDRARPLDFEVHTIESVTGVGARADERLEFLPLYRVGMRSGTESHLNCWYDFDRRPRARTARERERGARSLYLGSDIFLSIVDPNGEEAPYPDYLKQLEVEVLCSNRDLPMRMNVDPGEDHFRLDSGAPVDRIESLTQPTRPRTALPDSELAWRVVSHLSLNYLSLADKDPRYGATALRELLTLYADLVDDSVRRQVQGVRAVDTAPIHERIPVAGPATFGRGLEIVVTCDDAAFEAGAAFPLGSILEQFFRRHASINSFTRTVLRSPERGEVMRWPTRIGKRKTV